MRRLCFLTLTAVILAGCAAAPEGARRPPEGWQHAQSLSNCGSTDGRYTVIGYPGPQNNTRSELQSTAWPVMGALGTMIRTGANGMPHGDVSSVSIEIVDGRPHFKGYAADGTELPLMEREWWCEEKALATRAVLGNVPSEKVPKVRDESVLRLWRAQDGALIAEQTLESVTPGALGSSSRHRPLTRTYFRFAPVAAQ